MNFGRLIQPLGGLLAAGLLLVAAPEAAAKSIRLRTGKFAPPAAAAPSVSPKSAAAPPESGLFLIQFTAPVQPGWRRELAAAGVELLNYVPDDAFVARLKNARLDAVRGMKFVTWAGAYSPAFKLSPELRAAPRAASAFPETVAVSVLLAPGAAAAELAAVRQMFLGLPEESVRRFGTILRGEMNRSQLDFLTANGAVLWVEPAGRIRLSDEVAAKIVGGDGGGHETLNQALGFNGTNVIVAVCDSGLDTGDTNTLHPDLAGRVVDLLFYGLLTNAADEYGHGTPVAGVIAGNAATGATNADGALHGLGLAPAAQLLGQRAFDAAGNPQLPPSGILTRDATRAGAVIGLNSWGEDNAGVYNLLAAEFDELVRDADLETTGIQPYIMAFSAGNVGPGAQTISSPASAKNVIAAGASQNNRTNEATYNAGPEAMADFSSRGPCADGRIKPDLVAPGTWITSARSSLTTNFGAVIDDFYAYQNGTSFAAPAVAGAAAVFVQFYRAAHTNATPSPALVKAALINSAHDLDNAFGTAPTPNMSEGWGRVDLAALFATNRLHEFHEQTVLLATGQTNALSLIVSATNQPLRITLAYTDVPGNPVAAAALVNDLDLEIIAPDGRVYRGNRFDGQGCSVPDAPGADSTNNVEGIRLAAPLPGEYTVRVIARNVPEDVLWRTNVAEQDFALAVSGGLLPPDASAVLFNRQRYTAPDVAGLKVVDRKIAGSNSVNVSISSTTETNCEIIVLTAADAGGVFTGAVATATGAPLADGLLQICDGDLLTASYSDALGGSNVLAFALADLAPPVLTNVTVTTWFRHAAISWQTSEPADATVRYGTNASLGQTVADAALTTTRTLELTNLIPGQTYYFLVASADALGNRATNDNGGALHSFTVALPATALLVDAYLPDTNSAPIPLDAYTNALNATGVGYDVWDVAQMNPPAPADLQPYRIVIWRVSDSYFAAPAAATLNAPQQTMIQDYLDGGGAFFMASMQILSRLGAVPFRSNVLQVAEFITNPDPYAYCGSCDEDHGVPGITGSGEVLASNLNVTLDYSAYPTNTFFGLGPDFGDTFMPRAAAAAIAIETNSLKAAGACWPRSGLSSTGRVVFLSFPLDAVPAAGPDPDDRADLLRNALDFLLAGSIRISNNLWQAPFTLTGPVGTNGQGRHAFIANAPPGEYVISFGAVPFYDAPAPQTNTLASGGTLTFTGHYTFADANSNGIADAWEEFYFGEVSSNRTAQTDTLGNGMTDYARFNAGLDPTNPAALLQLTATYLPTNGALQLDWPTTPAYAYRIVGATNLAGAGWLPLGGWQPAATNNAGFTLPATNGESFFRVEVQP